MKNKNINFKQWAGFICALVAMVIIFAPLIIHAQPIDDVEKKDLSWFVNDIVLGIIFNAIMPLLWAVAILAFVWGVVNFIIYGADKTKRKEGVKFITGGLIGLFVMLSIWGLIGLLTNTFQLDNETIDFPTFPDME